MGKKGPLILLVVALIVLFASNPSREAHENRVLAEARDAADNLLETVGGLIGAGIVTSVADYTNYGLFSTMRVENDLVSVGVLGFVFVFLD
jgi:hypothetical protein